MLANVRILRTNDTEELHEVDPSILLDWICRMINAYSLDSVSLPSEEGLRVMIVDDTGMVDGKPVNRKATELYHVKCGGPTPNSIHGDVAITSDSNFA